MDSPTPPGIPPRPPGTTREGGCCGGQCCAGCAVCLCMIFLACVGLFLWIISPYPERPVEGWLTPDTSFAAWWKIDLQDDRVWNLGETIHRTARESGGEGKDRAELDRNIQAELVSARRFRRLGSFEFIVLSQTEDGEERPVLVAPQGRLGTIFGWLFGAVESGTRSSEGQGSTLVRHGNATIVVTSTDAEDASSPYGFTVHRGHLMAGYLDPTLRRAIDHVNDGGSHPENSFVRDHWPQAAEGLVTMVVSNEENTLSRGIHGLRVGNEASRRSAMEAKEERENDEDENEESETPGQRFERHRREVKAEMERDQVWDGFEGLVMTGDLKGDRGFELTTHWILDDERSLGQDFGDLMRTISTLLAGALDTHVTVQIIEDDPLGTRAVFSFQDIIGLFAEMPASRAPSTINPLDEAEIGE